MTSFNSVGDLSRSFQLRLSQNILRSRVDNLTKELASGVKSDIPRALGGDLSRISHIESRLTMLRTFQRNASEAQAYFDGMQEVLGRVQASVDSLGPNLMIEANTADEGILRLRAANVEQDFRSMFNSLNTDIGGRYLFSGSRTDTPPLGNFDLMLTALNSAVAGSTSTADIVSRIDAWFDAGAGSGGFVDTLYQGDDSGSTQLSVSADRQVGTNLTANSAELRDTLKGMAIISYAAGANTTLDSATLRKLFNAAGSRLVNGSIGLTSSRAEIGQKQAAVAQAQVRNSSEISTFSIAHTELASASMEETATALEETEARIQALYMMTVRLSRLSLVDYMS